MKRCHLYLTVLFVCQLLLTVANAQVATDCTLYAAAPPAGNDANNGTTAATPKTFMGAANATVPGSVVCLEGLPGPYTTGPGASSTFEVPHSGTPSAWITYKAYGDAPPIFSWTGPSGTGQIMFRMGDHSSTTGFPNSQHYIKFIGLTLNGNELASAGFQCFGGHHITWIGNTVKNVGGVGIGSVQCDYLTADHNLIWHNGMAANSDPSYAPCCGWSSGISYNSVQFFDTYTGLHNLINNNIISGEVDGSTHHTDGNGIVLDLSCPSGCGTLATANTPPVLIMNNVVYDNGARCIAAFNVSNFYIINNTCYKNGTDLTMNNPPGSLFANQSTIGYFVDNISRDWKNTTTSWAGASLFSYQQAGADSSLFYYKNMWFDDGATGLNFTPSDPLQFFNLDPQFVSPPSINPNLGHQYANATDPALIGTALTLQGSSPAGHAGIDPSTISGLPAQIVTDLRLYIYRDINGITRAAGNWNLGAYQFAPPAPPGGLTTTAH